MFTKVDLIVLRPLLAGEIEDIVLFIVSNTIQHLVPIYSVQVGVKVRQVIEGHHPPIGWIDLCNLICQPVSEQTQKQLSGYNYDDGKSLLAFIAWVQHMQCKGHVHK